MLITSLDNERVKKYIKLKEKKFRDQTGEFIVEGSHLVLEAYRAGLIKELILEKDLTSDALYDKIMVDDVQDPGNLGTIIRSAVAFNIDTVILSKNTVDLYNPKTIRATQGMFFHINVIKKDLLEVMKYLDDIDVPVYGTLVEHGEDVRTLNEKDKKKFALIVGNEGNGVHKEISDKCDKNLYIKMNSDVESLNVGVATSILLYELGR